jgi:hypothetical protein
MKINKLKDGTYKLSITPNGFINNDLVNEKNMFLYNRKKTIGLRKDKKLHKFVGIRDGYSKQLEFSIKSLIIDDSEKISKNRVKFTSINLEDSKVVHNMNGTLLYNDIDSSNYRNMVKIDEYFEKIEITYEVHIKGLRVLNKNVNNRYIPDNDQYILTSLKNNKKIFIIDKPVVIDKDGRYYNIVEDKLYIEDGKLFYKKIVTNFDTNLQFPLFVDANIIFNLSNFGELSRTLTNNISLADVWNKLRNTTITTNVTSNDLLTNYLNENPASTFNGELERLFLSFDTSEIDKKLIYKVELNLLSNSSNGIFSIQKGEQSTILDSNDWDAFSGTYYDTFDASLNSNVIDLGVSGITDINESGLTQYCIRDYIYDYNNVTPPDLYSVEFNHEWSFVLDVYVYDLITNTQIKTIPINEFGFGVMSSSGSSWSNTKSGDTVNVVFGSLTGEYGESVGVKYDTSDYTLNRTFLKFDTSLFRDYVSVLSSVKLKLDNYMENNEGIVVTKGTQSLSISSTDWNNYSDFYTGTLLINNGFITEFELPLSSLDRSGYTSLALISYHDYYNDQPLTNIDSFSGIDFEESYLEVIQSPIKVYGKTIINVKLGDYFEIEAYTNYGDREDIMWYRDSGYTNFISSGSSLVDYSIEYETNNKIYAILILDENFVPSTTISPQDNHTSVPLIITVNIDSIEYPTIPEKYANYDAIDIDSIYYKYHKCISGVCYTYVRDIEDIYEGFPLVSDNWGNNSYNLYNEFDIIDEFFSNTSDVEVAYNQNLDLNNRYNDLDGAILREGTRVLLMAQDDVVELGVYTVQYDNKLVKTDEMDTYDKVFRYKAHVGAGNYIDEEIHIWPILPPPPPPSIEGTPNPMTFVYDSGLTQTLSIISNTTWEVYNIIPWISVSKSEGVGNDNIILTTTMENLTGVVRSGKIEFSGFGGATTVLVVYQNPYIVIPNTRTTTDDGDRITTENDFRIILP